MTLVPHPTIVCPDCGGPASLVQVVADEDEFEPGDIVTYRCADCHDRWDLVLQEEDFT